MYITCTKCTNMDITSNKHAQISITSKVHYNGIKDGDHIFSYKIRIRNQLSFPIKLISRKWIVQDLHKEDRVVKGQGVVGMQPVLGPGESFSYESWCPISSGYGKMNGHFVFEHFPTPVRFRVEIPGFELIQDVILN